MTTQRRHVQNWVLVYSEEHDPSREETAEVLDHLKSVSAREIIPGTIQITGSESEIGRCVDGLDQWKLSTEKIFNLNPPHKSRLR